MLSRKDKLLESAQRLVLKGQVDRAIKAYQQIVALEPKEVRYRQKLAELLVRDHRKEEAIVEYDSIGKHYADNSYFLRAIAVYKQIQRLSPANIDIALTIASLNHSQGLCVNAMAQYGQVVAQLEEQGSLKEAVKVLEKMIEVDGDHAATRLKYAELLLLSGDKKASCQAFARLLGTLRAGGHGQEAHKVSSRLAQLFPDYPQDPLAAIPAQMPPAEVAGAIASCHETPEGDGKDLKAWQLLCAAERGKGNKAGLRHALQQLMDLFPGDLDAIEEAIRCDLEAGDIGSGMALLERHCSSFLEKGGPLPAEDLFWLLPDDVAGKLHTAKQSKLVQQLAPAPAACQSRVAAGQNEIPLELTADWGLSAPTPFAPADASLETAREPGSCDAWSTDEAQPSATLPPPAAEEAELPCAWGQEITLDLDDDLPGAVAPAVADIEISLDFSLPLDFDELGTPLGNAPPFLSDCCAPDEGLLQLGLALDLEEKDPLESALAKPGAGFGNVPWPTGAEEAIGARALRGWQEIYPDSAAPADAAIDAQELESHYDLGICYKEMGLYAAAIDEFAVAAGNPQRRLDCLTLQAICYREQGEPAKARGLLQRGHDLEVLSCQERMSLSYELALLLETTGAFDEAILLYREVAKLDPAYGDVGHRLARLSGDELLDF